MEENELLLKRNLREEILNDDRLEVLDKVKFITTIPNTQLSVAEQVANYYEVGVEAIKSLVKRNQDELISNGYKLLTGAEVKEILVSCNVNFTNNKGYFSVGDINFANRSNGLFNKRSILNVGMLLEESLIAKEVRTLLLDNHFQLQDVHEKLVNGEEIEIDKTDPNYFINREAELRQEEKSLLAEMSEAILKGDLNTYMTVNCKANNIKEQIIALAKEKEELSKDKVDGFDRFIGTENLLSWDIVAKNLNQGRNKMLNELRKHKILITDTYEYRGKTYFGEHHNVPYQRFIDAGYFDVKFSVYGDKRKATTKVTAKGQEYIFKKLKEWGSSNLKTAM